MRKKHTPGQKVAIVLETLKGEKTINELAGEYGVHPTQIHEWSKRATEGLSTLFTDGRTNQGKSQDRLISELYQVIGERETELAWLKKKLHLDP